MRVVCHVLVVTFVLGLVAQGSRAAEEQSAVSLRVLVEARLGELDAHSLVERSRAERQLLDLGPDVLPLLPAPDLVRSPAVREAVKRVRRQLEQRAARESALASRVTLHGEWTIE